MDIYSKVVELQKSNTSFVLVTVVESSGSVPGKVGFKMIVDLNGNSFGTVGGGAIEFEAIKYSKNILLSGNSEIKKYILSKSDVISKEDETVLPMRCNGKVTLFYESIGNKPKVYVFGGGHVGQALCKVLPGLGYHLTLIDDREEYASEQKCPGAHQYVFNQYEDFCNSKSFEQDCFVTILTYGHSFDYKILKILFGNEIRPKYIGAIASKAKSSVFRRDLYKEFGENLNLANLYSPIGMKIGGTTANEIAISITAEMQSIRYEKKIK